ncbi:MAG: winged helix-turn-helix domain-containing protein [Bacteroidetes bacterium]|nr:winged helix-turn-helix domain-containing protein [Bacteroidota bacterium]
MAVASSRLRRYNRQFLEEVIRTLSAFNKEGLISLVGKRIRIIDPDALKEMISSFGPLKIP